MSQTSFIRWFRDLGLDDVPLVGGKNASLGELRPGRAHSSAAGRVADLGPRRFAAAFYPKDVIVRLNEWSALGIQPPACRSYELIRVVYRAIPRGRVVTFT